MKTWMRSCPLAEGATATSRRSFRDGCQPRLVGGSTRIGAVQELVRSLVGGKELNQSAPRGQQGLWASG